MFPKNNYICANDKRKQVLKDKIGKLKPRLYARKQYEVEVIRIEGDQKTSVGRFPNGSYGAFRKNTVEIPDATSETKLLIGAPSGTTVGGRFFVDNITLRM